MSSDMYIFLAFILSANENVNKFLQNLNVEIGQILFFLCLNFTEIIAF